MEMYNNEMNPTTTTTQIPALKSSNYDFDIVTSASNNIHYEYDSVKMIFESSNVTICTMQ